MKGLRWSGAPVIICRKLICKEGGEKNVDLNL